ncbi:MAG TPA: cytochrome c-type biogenesis protein [Gemmatimonadaceae bacterium]|nr:cytochrome c-type biogenesis protein [Gemmatimonadaceae bacterium]
MMRILTVLTAAAVVLASHPLSAQTPAQRAPAAQPDSALEAMTTRLASELRCPVCQGNSIQDSPSELAQQMRDVIRDQLRSGKTPDEVRAYFVDKYGEWILLAPRAEGLNLIVYLVPFAAVLLGGLVVWRTVRKWTAAPPSSTADTPPG